MIKTEGGIAYCWPERKENKILKKILKIPNPVRISQVWISGRSSTDDWIVHMGSLWSSFEVGSCQNLFFVFSLWRMCIDIQHRECTIRNVCTTEYFSSGIKACFFVRYVPLFDTNPNLSTDPTYNQQFSHQQFHFTAHFL